jgi:hypothetical protein
MTKREAVARAVWDTLGADYTFDEAVSGLESLTHFQAVNWVYQIADVSIAAIETQETE